MRSLIVVALLLVAAANAAMSESERALLDKARDLQNNIERLNEEMSIKMQKIEIDTHKAKVPLYKERNEALREIKGFWAKILTAHPNHHAWIFKEDKTLLELVTDVIVRDISTDGTEGKSEENGYYPLHTYRVEMHFRPNDYFTEHVLWRDMRGSIEESTPSGIHWQHDKRPTDLSFFNFFEKKSDVDAEQSPRPFLDEHLLHEIAHSIRYELWNAPFTFYDTPYSEDYYSHYQHLTEDDVHPDPEVEEHHDL